MFAAVLSSCGGQEGTPADDTSPTEAEATDTAMEPSPTPEPTTPGVEFVTSLDQIVGTWIATADLENFVATITEEGRFVVATSLIDLENGSAGSWKLSFEENQITATGFALCLGDTGLYQGVINPDGTLKFTTIIDPCTSRLRKMDRSLPGRLTPYDLVYYRVE